ncbi:hypothetical protein RB195_014169 [Necator americanus]|uniref:Uncharacterized protein n=1 Tax=Necator americanus TaxID=51031 RepID=A0ABR1DYX8_NECAM
MNSGAGWSPPRTRLSLQHAVDERALRAHGGSAHMDGSTSVQQTFAWTPICLDTLLGQSIQWFAWSCTCDNKG